jgi:DNA modification methylase
MDKRKKINITYVDSCTLFPAAYNPRKWDEIAIEKLTDNIKRFGIIDPLIVNSAESRKNIIIGGHFRFEVAKRLGINKVPVVYVNIPDAGKEKELNLRLNRNTGNWDFNLLKAFDVDLLFNIGFDDNDISNIWDDQLSVEDDNFNFQEELEKIKKVKTKPGDIYRLGTHILGCGDATDDAFIDKLVGIAQIDMVYLDPPYNIRLDYDKGIGTKSKYGGKLTNDNKPYDQYKQFLILSLKNALSKIKSDAHIFCYCDESYIGLLQKIYKDLGIDNKRVCLWIKNNQNTTPQVAFNKVYEPCVYGTIGKPYISNKLRNLNEVLNKQIGTGNRMQDDIYDMFNIWLEKRLPTTSYEHPTEKPPTLHEKPIRRCTKVAGNILDLFGGSGSTLIAAEQLKRSCYMIEIEPRFCDLIIKRYKNLTGKEAKSIMVLKGGKIK